MRIGNNKMEQEGGKKLGKRVSIPKDRHAPKKPITAYNLYAADERVRMKKENPDRSFGEMNREIGRVWTILSPDKKQPYLDKAERCRQQYMKEVEEYQKTEQYKKYLQTIVVLQQRQHQRKAEKEKKKNLLAKPSKETPTTESSTTNRSPSLPPPSRPPPLSLKQSFVAGTEIPVFTNQFLLHNRELEVQVRKLRQSTMDLEEENALLSRHIDNMQGQTQRLESDIQNQILKNRVLKQRLVCMQETLTDTFSGVSVPGIDSVPSVDTILDYLKEVESVVARQQAGGDQKSEVVSMVRRVAKETIEQVRRRSEDGVSDEKMETS